MRRAGRSTLSWLEKMPGDSAENRSENRLLRDKARVDDAYAGRLRDGGRCEGAGKVRRRRDGHRESRSDGSRPDPRRHVVRRVVEAVREVEGEADDDDGREQEGAQCSAVLDDDRLEDVCGVLARVDRVLELLVDVLPADDG